MQRSGGGGGIKVWRRSEKDMRRFRFILRNKCRREEETNNPDKKKKEKWNNEEDKGEFFFFLN